MKNKILSKSRFHEVIALSETEVGKIVFSDQFAFVEVDTGINFFPDVFKKDIDKEILYLSHANKINNLLVKFLRKEKYESKEMMVMERLYPLPYNHFNKRKRKTLINIFEEKLLELHLNGFVHGDIEHPRIQTIERFDNIILTETGLRLIDTGFSALKSKSENEFRRLCMQDIEEMKSFQEYFLEL